MTERSIRPDDTLFADRTILITGVTGSLGRALAERALSGVSGIPRRVIGLSRDEEKQHHLRITDTERLRRDERAGRSSPPLDLRLGDVRDPATVAQALRGVDLVFHSAALKQVPTCEYHPEEALRTNVLGPQNIVRAIAEQQLPVEVVVGISTDKACLPVSVLGMTKALAERVFVRANLDAPRTRFVNMRSGNLIASRGSVVPHFLDQIDRGGPVTVTDPAMTRFLLPIEAAVDAIVETARSARRGETIVPKIPAVRLGDLARALIGDRPIEIEVIGARPGEKSHELLVSEEESARTRLRGGHYIIAPHLPELVADALKEESAWNEAGASSDGKTVTGAVRSDDAPLAAEEVSTLLGCATQA